MRKTAYNRRLAQWRLTWLIEDFISHQFLWCINSFELRNPPLRPAPNRLCNSGVRCGIPYFRPHMLRGYLQLFA